MSHPYQYAVLRFVPRVDRGECLNVGVVVHSQSAGVLRCAFHLDEPRIVAFGDAVSRHLHGTVIERLAQRGAHSDRCPLAHRNDQYATVGGGQHTTLRDEMTTMQRGREIDPADQSIGADANRQATQRRCVRQQPVHRS